MKTTIEACRKFFHSPASGPGRLRSDAQSIFRGLIAGTVSLIAAHANAQAPLYTYTSLHNFGGKVNGPLGPQQYDGVGGNAPVSFDSSGNLYGVTTTGGYRNGGQVWEITSAGSYKVLHNFGAMTTNADGKIGLDGANSEGAVTVDAAGNLYGTTANGGAGAAGIVWEITAGGVYKDLHDFESAKIVQTSGKMGMDGGNPQAGVTFDSSGNMYGTATAGGTTFSPNSGIVWEITKAGVYKDVHDFGLQVVYSSGEGQGQNGADGANPDGGVTFDKAGNMWGTTSGGGYWGLGILWEITTAGTYYDLHDFGQFKPSEVDGLSPQGSVVIDGSNNVYGTTSYGGPLGYGGAWEYKPSGQYVLLHNFFFGTTITTSNGTPGPDGSSPNRDVALDSLGNLYGTCSINVFGNYAYGGIVWEITQSGQYIDLHDFGGRVSSVDGGFINDGQLPAGGVALDRYNNVYGTTASEGALGNGVTNTSGLYGGQNPPGATGPGMIWTIGSLHLLTLQSGTVGSGGKVTGSVLLGQRAPIGGTTIQLSGSDANASPPSYVHIPANDYIASFTVDTGRITGTDTTTITATQMYATLMQSLVINPATVAGFSYFNGPKGGSTATINVDLTAPAPASGLTVTLSSNSAKASVPATVVVPAGSTSASFTITYGSVTSPTPVVITGTVGLVNATANITVNP